MLVRAPIRIALTSPRSLHPYQILEYSPTSTSPIITAEGTMKGSEKREMPNDSLMSARSHTVLGLVFSSIKKLSSARPVKNRRKLNQAGDKVSQSPDRAPF